MKSLIVDIGSDALPAFLMSDSAFLTPESQDEPEGCASCGSLDGMSTERFAKFPIGTYTNVSGFRAAPIAWAGMPSMTRFGLSKPFTRPSGAYGSDFGQNTGTMS